MKAHKPGTFTTTPSKMANMGKLTSISVPKFSPPKPTNKEKKLQGDLEDKSL